MTFDWLDILTTVLGLIYIWLEYRASIALWLVGIIMPALDIYLYYNHGLYGDSAMACYYTGAAIYGYLAWKWGKKGQQELPISHMPLSKYLPTALFFVVAWVATYYILIWWTNSTVPLLDSFTNALSFVGLWALSRKYLEQWFFWIVVDAVCTVLYMQKGIPFKAGLYGLYVIIAVLGYFKWKKMMKAQAPLLSPLGGMMPKGWDSYACILADGDFPTASIPLQLLRNAGFVCCCDGAARYWPAADAIVGDGDSCPPELRHLLHQVSEQDDNDLTKATRFCMEQGYRSLVYLGATGGREDHTLGNISLLMRYRQEFDADCLMATDHGWFTPACGPATFQSFSGQQVSLFNFGSTTFRTSGLRYQGYPFSQWWQGTLNEALGESFAVEADGGYMVFRTYERKQNPT